MTVWLAFAVLAVSPAAPPAAASADLATLWADACKWEVGSNAETVPLARAAIIAHGDRALAFLIPAKLDTKDTLITRALDVIIKGIGKAAVPALVECIASDNANVRRNAADLLGSLGSTESAGAIMKLLADPDARLGALAALGKLQAESAVAGVAEVMRSSAPERVRYTAALTLGQIGGDAANQALATELGAKSAPLRFAAQYALEGQKAITTLRGFLGHDDQRVRLHAIAALGHISDAGVRTDLLPLLDDSDAMVRGFAAEALGAMLDAATRARIELLIESESSAFVRGAMRAALNQE